MSEKRNATQRLEDLERALMSLYQTADNMARDLMTIKEAIKLLGNKTDAIAKLSNISDEAIGKGMIDNNVTELQTKVSALVSQGVLVVQDSVTDASFIVGKEVTKEGELANPRLQFAVSALADAMKEKLKGKVVGDVIILEEDKLRLEVVEIYEIQAPTAPQAEETEQVQA